MAWQEEMTTVLRALIDDLDATTYTDDRLETLLTVAAFQVATTVDFPVTYVADPPNQTITPDPTISPNRDDNFINLVTIKAACIIDRGSASRVSGQAIRIKDGTSEIDLRGVPQAKMALLKQGWCATYEGEKTDYLTSQSGYTAGAAVVSPFRVFVGYGGPQARWR